MTQQTETSIFDGATITIIRHLNATDDFEGVQELDGVDLQASADRFWELYRDAVAEAYPTATVEIDTPWRQHSKPNDIDIDLAEGAEWDDACEEERAAIHSIGEAVFERGDFWTETNS